MKQILTILLAALLIEGFAQNKFVYLGNYDKTHLSIRIDGDGEIYPDYDVPIDSGCNEGTFDRSFVEYMYDKDCRVRTKVLTAFNLPNSLSFEDIQKKIVRLKIAQINEQLTNQNIDNVTFIMVGFNNHYSTERCIDCANDKLTALKQKITDHLDSYKKKTLVVEFYWDHTETECEGVKTALNLSNSCVNSTWAGLALREIINGLKCQKIQMISHSMGANIITETIFNQYSKFGRKFNRELKPYRKKIKVSDKTFAVGMVAPAIPGVNTFIDYLDPKNKNNVKCKFVIGFNTNDESLKKQFLGLPANPSHFSSTTLGCLESEVDDVAKLFEHDHRMYDFIKKDFSLFNGVKQTKHGLEFYMKQPEYIEMLNILYDIPK